MPSVAPIREIAPTASHRFSLGAVFSSSFGVGLIFGFQPPLMALVLERGGASSFEIGAVTSVSTLAVILCGPFYPRTITRLGLRAAIILGVGISTAMMFVMPWLPGFRGWLVLRFVTGCAIGLEWIASEIWLNRLSTDQSRGTVMGAYATVFAAGVTAGPLLLQITGTSGWRPFATGALCLALTALPLFAARNHTAADSAPGGRLRVLALCAAVCVIGPILLSAVLGTAWLSWPLLLLWGGTMYGFYTQGIALLGESYPHAELADANTVFVVVYCAGGIVGPSLGGLAMDWWQPNGLLVFLSGAPLLLAAPLLRRVRKRSA